MDSLEQPGRAPGRRTWGWSGGQCSLPQYRGARDGGQGRTGSEHAQLNVTVRLVETPGLNWEVQRD